MFLRFFTLFNEQEIKLKRRINKNNNIKINNDNSTQKLKRLLL